MNKTNIETNTASDNAPKVKREVHHSACNYFFGYDNGRCNCNHGTTIAGMTKEQTETFLKN